MRKTTVTLLAALILSMCASAQAVTITLADLLQPNATIISGDKLFYGFSNYSSSASGAASSVNPADIVVSNYYNAGLDEYGLLFQSTAKKPPARLPVCRSGSSIS